MKIKDNVVSLARGTTHQEEDISLSSPTNRLSTIFSDDIYGIRELVKLVEQKLIDSGQDLNTWKVGKKISDRYNDLFEKNPETGELYYFEFVRYVDMLFDKLYQRKDLFNVNNVTTSLKDCDGYIEQAEKPFILFLRPKGTVDKDGNNASGLYNPDGQHACTMKFIAGGQKDEIGSTCKVYKFKPGTSLETMRKAEMFVFQTMQEVTTMTAESRFKVYFYSYNDYGSRGRDAQRLGEFLWRQGLNCVDLFDKSTHKLAIDSIGALKRAEKFYGNLEVLPDGIEIYKRVWNTQKQTQHASTIKMNIDVVSAISGILKGFSKLLVPIDVVTETNGQVDQQILVDALVNWTHNYQPKDKWTVGKAKSVSNLVKSLAPHLQIISGAIRIATIYNNWFVKNKELHQAKGLMIKEEVIDALMKIVELSREEEQKAEAADLNDESVKGLTQKAA